MRGFSLQMFLAIDDQVKLSCDSLTVPGEGMSGPATTAYDPPEARRERFQRLLTYGSWDDAKRGPDTALAGLGCAAERAASRPRRNFANHSRRSLKIACASIPPSAGQWRRSPLASKSGSLRRLRRFQQRLHRDSCDDVRFIAKRGARNAICEVAVCNRADRWDCDCHRDISGCAAQTGEPNSRNAVEAGGAGNSRGSFPARSEFAATAVQPGCSCR